MLRHGVDDLRQRELSVLDKSDTRGERLFSDRSSCHVLGSQAQVAMTRCLVLLSRIALLMTTQLEINAGGASDPVWVRWRCSMSQRRNALGSPRAWLAGLSIGRDGGSWYIPVTSEERTMRLTLLTWAAFATATLTAAVVPGQQLLSEAAPRPYAPFPFAPSAVEPPPPEPIETAPPEIGPPLPAATAMPPDTIDGFGMGGRGMGAGMGGPGMRGPGYGATWYPSHPVSGSNPETEFGLVRQDLLGAVPVWRDGGDLVLLSAGVRNSLFFTDAVLPDSHRPFPSELWNVHLGTNFMHKFDNGWSGGLGINFGSASDKPFHSIHEMNVGFNSFLQVPVKNDRDAWRFSLMYSPVGSLSFPIPGIAYLWNPSDDLRVSIGLPLAVMWRPVEDLTINVSYFPLTIVNARATYAIAGRLFFFGGFEWAQEAYLLADREDVSERFMGYEKRLIGGVRWDVWQHSSVELNAGYAFDRSYGVGQNGVNNLHDEVNIAAGAFVSAHFRVRF
jgi:hypothetical protein